MCFFIIRVMKNKLRYTHGNVKSGCQHRLFNSMFTDNAFIMLVRGGTGQGKVDFFLTNADFVPNHPRHSSKLFRPVLLM